MTKPKLIKPSFLKSEAGDVLLKFDEGDTAGLPFELCGWWISEEDARQVVELLRKDLALRRRKKDKPHPPARHKKAVVGPVLVVEVED